MSFFFLSFYLTVKLDATNSILSNTEEVRPIYLKMGHIMSETCFLSYVKNKGADQPAHPRRLISAFVVRCLNSNEILQLKAIQLDWHIHCIRYLQPVSLRKASYRYMYICLSLSFTLQERCYTDSVSLCRFFVINLFDKK